VKAGRVVAVEPPMFGSGAGVLTVQVGSRGTVRVMADGRMALDIAQAIDSGMPGVDVVFEEWQVIA
jgi:hypothetical protein